MAKLSYLVVSYNHTTKEFDYDVETTLANFPNGWIWDEEKETWKYPEDEEEDGNDADSVDELATLFMKYNNSK